MEKFAAQWLFVVENRELSRRMGKIAVPHVPRFPFDLVVARSVELWDMLGMVLLLKLGCKGLKSVLVAGSKLYHFTILV